MQDQAGIAILALKRSVPPLQKAADQAKRSLGGSWISKTTVSMDGHFVMRYQSIYKGGSGSEGNYLRSRRHQRDRRNFVGVDRIPGRQAQRPDYGLLGVEPSSDVHPSALLPRVFGKPLPSYR